jgi:hypothetical protein
MTDAIKVTVDGPPVTAKVTWEKVREYLTRKGWAREGGDERINRWWNADTSMWVGPSMRASSVVEWIARHEQRHPADVLREIAGVAEPAATTLTRATVGPWLRAEADHLDAAQDMGLPVDAIEEMSARAKLLRAAADDLDGGVKASVLTEEQIDTLLKARPSWRAREGELRRRQAPGASCASRT